MSTDPTTSPEAVTNTEAAAEQITVPDPGIASDTAAVAEPMGASATAESPTLGPPAGASAVPARRPRAVALVVTRRLLQLGFTVALFGLGLAIGWQTHAANQPITAVVGDPAVVGVPNPPVVVELANAIGDDDADRIRAALSPQIFASYTAEMERFGISTIESVETLGTYVDGPRSATVLVLLGRTADRSPFTIHLVVLTQDGLIARLR